MGQGPDAKLPVGDEARPGQAESRRRRLGGWEGHRVRTATPESAPLCHRPRSSGGIGVGIKAHAPRILPRGFSVPAETVHVGLWSRGLTRRHSRPGFIENLRCGRKRRCLGGTKSGSRSRSRSRSSSSSGGGVCFGARPWTHAPRNQSNPRRDRKGSVEPVEARAARGPRQAARAVQWGS